LQDLQAGRFGKLMKFCLSIGIIGRIQGMEQ
jgi:hypothetical protein